MKMYKKVMAAALAGVMTVSMSATAFAADDDGYILKATNEDSKSSDNDLVYTRHWFLLMRTRN